MRLLYLQPAEAFGGAERQGVLHIKHLPRFGFDVLPIVGPGRPIRDALRREGVGDYVFFRHFPSATHSRLSLFENLRYLDRYWQAQRRSVDALWRLVKPLQIDLVIANRTFGWLVAAPLAARLGVPYVLRAGSRPASRLAPLGLHLLRRAWPPPAALLSNCEAVERGLKGPLGCPARVVPNAVDTDRFDPTPRRRTVPAARAEVPVVGMAARPAPEKGFDLFIRVVRRVRERVPSVVFKVAGEFGWRPHFEAVLGQAGLAPHVQFLGHVEDMVEFYADCDVVVLTSKARSIEGAPNALLEAMAMERPVVATAVGGVPETLDHAVEGFLVPDGDADAFAGHVTTLLFDRTLRAEMGAAGRARIVRRHGISRVMAGLALCLRSAHCEATRRGLRARRHPLPVPRTEASRTQDAAGLALEAPRLRTPATSARPAGEVKSWR